jgi:hypothetical protein
MFGRGENAHREYRWSLSSGNGLKICGHSNWKLGKSKNIQKPGCPQLGAYPLSMCKGEYDIVKVEGQNLFFGARPADGNLCSEDRRPKELGSPLLKE